MQFARVRARLTYVYNAGAQFKLASYRRAWGGNVLYWPAALSAPCSLPSSWMQPQRTVLARLSENNAEAYARTRPMLWLKLC